jgi:hypothetical protein
MVIKMAEVFFSITKLVFRNVEGSLQPDFSK